MTRARRRMAHRTRLSSLSSWQRWAIVEGNTSASAFPTQAAWQETFDSVKGALLEELDDPAVTFRGFWLNDPSVPDELRDPPRPGSWLLAPPAEAKRLRADYDHVIAARRAWLREQRYR